MSKITDYFRVEEFVCPHVFKRFGQQSWKFIDHRIKETVLVIRENIDAPMYINNWVWGGENTQRGLRCNLCQIVKDKTANEEVYLSGHPLALAVDFKVKGMTAQEVRDWLRLNQILLPYPIRVESDITWVHIDVLEYGQSGNKITYFKG